MQSMAGGVSSGGAQAGACLPAGASGARETTLAVLIDGRRVEVRAGTSILEAAQLVGVEIPTLCYHPALPPDGSCEASRNEAEE